MEELEWLQHINSEYPRAVLGKEEFLCPKIPILRVEPGQILFLVKALSDRSKTWPPMGIESLCAADVGSELELLYLLHHQDDQRMVMGLRVTLPFGRPGTPVSLDSISGVWPLSALFETEISDLFGVHFRKKKNKVFQAEGKNFLIEDWDGYPLRKEYLFLPQGANQ